MDRHPLTSEIQAACERLRQNGLVAIPTETVYGLAGRIGSTEALERIFTLKCRPFFDPLIVHISEPSQLKHLVSISAQTPLVTYLAKTFWPGPLTLVLEKSESVHSWITSGLPTVAVRMPQHSMTLQLIDQLGEPVAAPSANLFGQTSPSTAAHVRANFNPEDVFILDGGDATVGIESTVVRPEKIPTGWELQILRPGAVTAEKLIAATRDFSEPVSVIHVASSASPGHTEHHYQPKKPLLIAHGQPYPVLQQHARRWGANENPRGRELLLAPQANIAARELYAQLHSLGNTDIDFIYVHHTPEQTGELWVAVWDRLQRAASLQLESFQMKEVVVQSQA